MVHVLKITIVTLNFKDDIAMIFTVVVTAMLVMIIAMIMTSTTILEVEPPATEALFPRLAALAAGEGLAGPSGPFNPAACVERHGPRPPPPDAAWLLGAAEERKPAAARSPRGSSKR